MYTITYYHDVEDAQELTLGEDFSYTEASRLCDRLDPEVLYRYFITQRVPCDAEDRTGYRHLDFDSRTYTLEEWVYDGKPMDLPSTL